MWACEKFKQFIQGYECTVITDHSALHWLYTKQELLSRLARWLVRLREFDLEIVHRKEKVHKDADTLSRHAIEPATQIELDFGIDFDSCNVVINGFGMEAVNEELNISLENFMKAQLSDLFCQKMIELINSQNKKRHDKEFLIVKNILMKTRFGNLVAVMPKSLVKDVMFLCHDHVGASHLGFNKTLQN